MPGIYGMVNRMPPTVAGAPTTLLLDAYPSAAFAYSFRKLRAAYAGSAIRLRGADTTEGNIGFSGNNFDTAAAAAFVVAHGASTIVTKFDQSGNGADITQGTAANQPAYSATGLNSLPTASFVAASSQYLRSASLYTGVNGVTDATATVVSSLNASTANYGGIVTLIGHSSSDDYNNPSGWCILLRRGTNQEAETQQVTTEAFTSITYDQAFHASSILTGGGSGSASFKINNGTAATGSVTVNIGSDAGGIKICIGGRQSTGVGGTVASFFQGNVSEVVCWSSDQTSNRAAIYTDQKTYWGTP